MPRTFVVLGALLLAPLLASAQRTAPGARIRLAGAQEGVLLEWRGDGALVRTRGSDESVFIPSDQLVRRGIRRQRSMWGGAIGAGLGFAESPSE
jgi:hypothetical protein